MSTDTSLYVVVTVVHDTKRQVRARKTLLHAGQELVPGVFEVAATAGLVGRLKKALDADIQPGDEVRIYPVCARCRERAALYGTEDLATVPSAYII